MICMLFNTSIESFNFSNINRYVPALKPLRQIALILNFPRIEQTILAKRLLTVKIKFFILNKNKISFLLP
jgi:hypothetical protein